MKTLAVMCMALTRQSPSLTPDSATIRSTRPVMFVNPILSATWKVRYSVLDFMVSSDSSGPHCDTARGGIHEDCVELSWYAICALRLANRPGVDVRKGLRTRAK